MADGSIVTSGRQALGAAGRNQPESDGVAMHNELDLIVYPQGETVFRRGDSGDCAYLVREGLVEVLTEQDGREVRLSVIGTGELFGEIALIDEGPRTATVRTLQETLLVPIPRSEVRELLEKSDPVMRLFLMVVLERFRAQQQAAPPQGAQQTVTAPSGGRSRVLGEAMQKLSLAHGISGALERDEFELHYQPVCALTTGNVVGFEALIRWRHPQGGLLPPKDFLWVAEQTGLIRQIGVWTLERACQDWPRLRMLVSTAHPFISINLSAAQLVSDTLADDLLQVIADCEVRPSELKFELTESVIIDQPELASRILERLVELGSSLALDDYGTGYSGLRHLQTYPIGTLKIDRAFIAALQHSAQSREIVQSSIALAHSLNMQVIAEGVEDERVRALLIEMECDFAQGWFYGRPKPLHDHILSR
jgi:EAL domain-containing protein (putative c-di-GMP-specific phosphodiesterase class I)/CRP-like cAMP-binding protein